MRSAWFSAIKWKVMYLFFTCTFHSIAQSPLLDSADLAEKPTFKYIQFALKENPDEIYKLSIHISERSLEVHPELIKEIRKFRNLQELRISGTVLYKDTLPAFITELPNLQLLSLSSYGYLPSSIENCQALETLYLSGFPDGYPVELGKLSNLRKLALSIEASFLPESIGDLSNLREFIIYRAGTRLKKLPKTIGQLQNLSSLTIEGTKIIEIPSEIGNLHNLTHLEIRRNYELHSLPKELFSLTNLKTLILYNNYNIKEFPTDFHLLKNLESLNIIYGGFNELPSMSGMSNLSYLEILGNDSLKVLPESLNDLKSLKELRLTSGNLLALPKKLNKLDQLERLTLQQGPSFNWEESMASLSKCDQLNTLDLSGNKHLPYFPENITMIKSLKKLTQRRISKQNSITGFNWDRSMKILSGTDQLSTLDISGHYLSELPISIGEIKTLDSLYIGGNDFLDFPVTFTTLGQLNLKLLSMYDCGLRRIPDEIGLLTSLEKLDLYGTDIDSLPTSLGKLTRLTHLNISHMSPTSTTSIIDGPYIPDGKSHCIEYISPAIYSIKSLKWFNVNWATCEGLTKEEILKQLPENCVLVYDD